MKKLFVGLSIFTFCFSSGQTNFSAGSRSAGMAHASVTNTDVWGTFNNQAVLANISEIEISAFFENRFSVSGLNTGAIALALPLGKGTVGISYRQFGINTYADTKTGIAYAMKLGENISAGIQINYQSTRFGDIYTPLSSVTGEIGICAKLSDQLTLGVHLYNPSRTKVAVDPLEYYPTVLRTGLSYQFSDKFVLVAEGMKDIDHSFVVKVGAEYKAHEVFHLRAGISTNPVLNTFGIRVLLNQFSLDLSAGYHQILGLSSQAGLNYTFGSKKLVQE